MMYAYLENTCQAKHWKKSNDLGKDAENHKNSIKEGCGAKVTTRPLSIKISKCCKSNFKSVKMAYLPTSVKVCPSGLHGVWQQLIHACWEAWGGGGQSEQQNLKVIKKSYGSLCRLTYPTECLHSMLVMSHSHEDLLREPTLVVGPPKKHKSTLLVRIFKCILGKKKFSKLLILAFIYKAMLPDVGKNAR